MLVRLHHRRSLIRQLIAAAIAANPSLFPNWNSLVVMASTEPSFCSIAA